MSVTYASNQIHKDNEFQVGIFTVFLRNYAICFWPYVYFCSYL